MTRKQGKQRAILGKGTPSKSDRRVLERAKAPVADEAPDFGGISEDSKIEPVDLSLHGDGITHWQDELPSERNAHREREGKIPKAEEK